MSHNGKKPLIGIEASTKLTDIGLALTSEKSTFPKVIAATSASLARNLILANTPLPLIPFPPNR